MAVIFGAEDEIRTRDIRLGKATLYHWATPACLFVAFNLFMLPHYFAEDKANARLTRFPDLLPLHFPAGKATLYHWATPAYLFCIFLELRT